MDSLEYIKKGQFKYNNTSNSWANMDSFATGFINFGLWYDTKSDQGTHGRMESDLWLYDALVDKLNITANDTVVELGYEQGAEAIRTLSIYDMKEFAVVDVTEEQAYKTQLRISKYMSRLTDDKIKVMNNHIKLCTDRNTLVNDILLHEQLIETQEKHSDAIAKHIEERNYVVVHRFWKMFSTLEPTDIEVKEKQYLDCGITIGKYGMFCDVRRVDVSDSMRDNIESLNNNRNELKQALLNLNNKISKSKLEIEMLSKKIKTLSNAKVIHQDTCKINLEENYADKIYSVGIPQNTQNFNEFASEIVRILKSDGKFVFCSYHTTSNQSWQQLQEQNMLDVIEITTPMDEVKHAFTSHDLDVTFTPIGEYVFEPLGKIDHYIVEVSN
ncbi:MAG: methyltransferase domain-containing protein [Rickettsiales bacterium]|nr:methyltransferase domain-containing protein [Rickettsiales bacterium]